MMTLQKRINAFTELGHIMKDAASDHPSSTEATGFRKLMDSQEQHNRWFTPENVKISVRAIASMLEKDKLEAWLKAYAISDHPAMMNTIAVIMAGNIPLVGFHDFMCVLITGNRILARTSSKDSQLIRALSEIICKINTSFNDNIIFTDRITAHYDAIIATGSDNTSRYFEYYFSQKPHTFRKNRNSVAIISKDTEERDMEALSYDIFTYFGLGCRNVSKIYLEEGLDPDIIFLKWAEWSYILNHQPYANNYLYNKSLFRINKEPFLDNGFLLLKHSTGFSSPVSVVFYDSFSIREKLMEELSLYSDNIQCIVSENGILFGQTQYPGPGDYADNMDTIEFITSLK